jgi:hypothetical protein
MATAARSRDQAAAGDNWYGARPDEVAQQLGVDPAVGLSSRQAADLLLIARRS